jgi:hypothetical protein
VLVKAGRPLGVAANTLLGCILRDMPMFAAPAPRARARAHPARATTPRQRPRKSPQG